MGFEVELWRIVSQSIPWLGGEGDNWKFRCMPFDAEMDDLAAPNGTCLIGMGGLRAKPKPKQAGESSVSYMDKGLAILTLAHKSYRQKLFT